LVLEHGLELELGCKWAHELALVLVRELEQESESPLEEQTATGLGGQKVKVTEQMMALDLE
jgi:hypothetical protein